MNAPAAKPCGCSRGFQAASRSGFATHREDSVTGVRGPVVEVPSFGTDLLPRAGQSVFPPTGEAF